MEIRIDRFIRRLLLAPLVPLTAFLSFWWMAYVFLAESSIPWMASIGMMVGILIDVIILPKLLDRKLSMVLWGTVFLFYFIFLFGFFMGVPVFCVLLAIPVGYIVGSRLALERADRQELRKAALKTALFFSLLMAMINLASALIALSSPSTLSDLRGMLGLNFDVTRRMVLELILVGGSMILAVGWGLAMASVWASFSFLKKRL